MVVITKPQITIKFIEDFFSYEEKIEIDLIESDFIAAYEYLYKKKKRILSKPIVRIVFFVVDEKNVIKSTHPQEIELNLTSQSFCEAYVNFSKERESLEEVNALVTMGNIISLGTVQAVTLGIQSQYQFPSTVGSAGQVLGYQGTSQLAWVSVGGAQGAQGNRGFQGHQGFQGAFAGNRGFQGNQGGGVQGSQGFDVGFNLPYRFNTSTTMASASGEVRFNNATVSSVTNIDISRTDRNSAGQQGVLDCIDNGTLIYFDSYAGGCFQYCFFNTTSVAKNATEYNYTVTYVSGIGALFSNNQEIAMGLARKGIGVQGSQGFQGFQGNQGPQGPQGAQGQQGPKAGGNTTGPPIT